VPMASTRKKLRWLEEHTLTSQLLAVPCHGLGSHLSHPFLFCPYFYIPDIQCQTWICMFVPEAPGGFIIHYENSLQSLYGTVGFICVLLPREDIQKLNRALEIDIVYINWKNFQPLWQLHLNRSRSRFTNKKHKKAIKKRGIKIEWPLELFLVTIQCYSYSLGKSPPPSALAAIG
jgi:hypothetical protein